MIIERTLTGALILLSVVFLGFQIFELEVEASGIRALLSIFLTTLYIYSVKQKRSFFLLFLLTFSIAEILTYFGWLIPIVPDAKIDLMYYIANSLYILSYLFLIIQIMISISVVDVVKKYPFHLLVLIILDVFSVVVVTNTATDKLSNYEYYMEFLYNAIIMILLTVSLINFIHKDDKKAINLLLGSIFIFFSEVLQLAYFYISDSNVLNVICSIFIVLAFLFFYLQSKLTHQPVEESLYHDLAT